MAREYIVKFWRPVTASVQADSPVDAMKRVVLSACRCDEVKDVESGKVFSPEGSCLYCGTDFLSDGENILQETVFVPDKSLPDFCKSMACVSCAEERGEA